MMKTRLNMRKIAKGLGAEGRGKVTAPGGYFGALQLLADAGFLLQKTTERIIDGRAEDRLSSRRRVGH